MSVVPNSVLEKIQNKPKLQSSSIKLNCPSGALNYVGEFITVIRKSDSDCRHKIFVVDNENTSCLLSRDVATKMGLTVLVEEILKEHGVGLLRIEPVKITLRYDATPYCLFTARKIAL